jgi:D-alanine transaminase
VRDGAIYAPAEGPEILPSTTRALALRLAADLGIAIHIQSVTEVALRKADEVMLGFATRGVLPVCQIDGAPVGAGRPGPVWTRLNEAFDAYRLTVASLPMDQEA